jgi:hypothetical protein
MISEDVIFRATQDYGPPLQTVTELVDLVRQHAIDPVALATLANALREIRDPDRYAGSKKSATAWACSTGSCSAYARRASNLI